MVFLSCFFFGGAGGGWGTDAFVQRAGKRGVLICREHEADKQAEPRLQVPHSSVLRRRLLEKVPDDPTFRARVMESAQSGGYAGRERSVFGASTRAELAASKVSVMLPSACGTRI